MNNFGAAFSITVGVEGGYQNNPNDRGNWTGGEIGVGENQGTKYGISAAAYPNLDIANLTRDQAAAIYQSDYWNKISGNALPSGVDIMVFDTAVNSGVGAASHLLQRAAGMSEADQDGDIGPKTLAAVQQFAANHGVKSLIIEYQAERNVALTENADEWAENGLGWSRRLFNGLLAAIGIA